MKKKIVYLLGIIIIAGLLAGYCLIFSKNVRNESFLYIPTGAVYTQVLDSLKVNKCLKNEATFKLIAKYAGYPSQVKAGRFLLKKGMDNKDLIKILKGGRQTPVNIVFTNARSINLLAVKMGTLLEPDTTTFISLLTDNDYLKQNYGFDTNTILAMFIPNTYQVYWNTSAENVLNRLYREYNIFWNKERENRLKCIGMNKVQVSILASIIEEETNKKSERPIMAGVYINRLRKGIPLQADPTVKFAVGDFFIKRIMSNHLKTDSPYNTYKYKGLPPGPICMPSINAIDAVLNYSPSNYYYFCAKEDFSGYHNFAASLAEHRQNAQKYRNALNKRDIK